MRRSRFWSVLGLALAALALPASAGAAGRCGSHPWCDTGLSPDQRADRLIRALTPDERIGLLAGDERFGVAGQGHTGTSDGVPRVGLPTIYYSDGPAGSRQGKATAMPAPLGIAATFDPAAAHRDGAVVASEVKAKGNDVVFAPTVNIMRTPLGGRTFEGYGEDPLLAARMGVGWIEGAQAQGVIGDVKHYAANNQEGVGAAPPGTPVGGAVLGNRLTVDARVDPRTLREIYLPAFEAAVKDAHVGSVMCAYNRVNGAYACENAPLLERILRADWGFKGFVLADYGASHGTAASLHNGLDFEPWPGIAYGPAPVGAALAARQASMADVDTHVHRILRTLFAYGALDRPAYRDDDAQIDKAGHAKASGELEAEAITLLRNDGVLPLDAGRLKTIAIIGSDADQFKRGGGSSAIDPFFFTTPRQAITQRAGPGVQVLYDDGQDPAKAAAVARLADVALVFASDQASEGADKSCLSLSCTAPPGRSPDDLVEAVAAANRRTAVVLETSGPVLTPWRDRVAAVAEAWYPGSDGGTAIARVLFGDTDPGGRLPATFPKRAEDIPTAGDPEAYPGVAERAQYKEGVLVGYRHYDAKGIEPAFPFGHGLSYTSWALSGLQIAGAADGSIGATVSVDVANTGSRAGTDVAQLYMALPSPRPGVVQPPRALKGFQRIALGRGGRTRVSFALDQRAFSYYDARSRRWQVARGCYRVLVGRSSRNLPQQAIIAVRGANCPGAVAAIPARGAHRCTSRRFVRITLKRVRRGRVRKVTVFVGGRRQRVFHGPRRRVRVKLAGLPRGRYRVRVVTRTTRGRRRVQTRSYLTCTPKRRARRHH
jgi:beta-glucosidase